MRQGTSAAVLLFLLALLTFGSAHSTTITTVGSLSYDDNDPNNIITDTLNDYDWLRLDTLPDYTYAQTLDATSVGGEYEQWNIAGVNEAQKFTDALLGVNACTKTDITFTTCYNSRIKSFNALLGDNFDTYSDKAWFLSDRNVGQTVGYIETYADKAVYKFNTGSNFLDSDEYSSSGSYASRPVAWLLYRDSVPSNLSSASSTVSVPTPPALILLIIGLILGSIKFNGYRKN